MHRFILAAALLLSGCAAAPTAEQNFAPMSTPTPKPVRTPRLAKRSGGEFQLPTLYWAPPRGAAERDWSAVFGGTVAEIKPVAEKEADGFAFARNYVVGKIKVERIFLNFPDNSEISIGSLLESEDFDGLRAGDKVIVFVHDFYEGSFARIAVAGTNSKLGFKVGDWNDPLVAALEKIAPCGRLSESIDTAPADDYLVKNHACRTDRDRLILDDPAIAAIWKRHDPQGFQYLTELRESERLEEK